MLADVLAALDVAHRAAVLHLDIKPANVLLDAKGGFVLTDFGVAQYSRMHRGLLPFSVGTRGYQAPEQKSEKLRRVRPAHRPVRRSAPRPGRSPPASTWRTARS